MIQRLLYAAILWAVLVLIAMLGGCEAPKQTQQADNKAVGRVLSKPELQARVGAAMGREADTIIINTERVVHDTLRMVKTIDRPRYTKECEDYERYINGLVFSTDRLIDTMLKNGIRVVIGPDGLKASYTATESRTVLRDRAEANRWRDSTDALRRLLIQVNERLATIEKEKTALKDENQSLKDKLATFGKKSKVPWWLWVIVIGGAVIGIAGFAMRKTIPWLVVWKGVQSLFGLLINRKKK